MSKGVIFLMVAILIGVLGKIRPTKSLGSNKKAGLTRKASPAYQK